MRERLDPPCGPAVAPTRPGEEGEPRSSPHALRQIESATGPIGVPKKCVSLKPELALHFLGLERALSPHRGENDRTRAAHGTQHAIRSTPRVHPTCISLVIVMSGAKEDITEQYFSTESSTA